MDRGQRKRLADICEKLGVAVFAGALLQGMLSTDTTTSGLLGRVLVMLVGVGLCGVAIRLSKETE